MAKKLLSLPLSPKLYGVLSQNAKRQGQSTERYAVNLIRSNVTTDPSLVHKTTVGTQLSGQSIIDHDGMVLINGVYYDYRLKGQTNENQRPTVHKHVVYQVVSTKGNIVILKPFK